MYKTHLHGKGWQEKKSRILHRDGYKCQSKHCKTPNSILDVHHKDYLGHEFKPEDYPDDFLISLCRVCHSHETDRFKAEEALLICLKLKGFLVGDLLALTAKLYTDKNFEKLIINELTELQNG